MELVLVRHGLPERDETTSDPPLSAIGKRQAVLAGAWLMREGPFDAVYASTMRRAIQTADAYCKASGGKACAQDERLVEFDRASGRYIPLEELKRTDYPAWKAFVDGGHAVDIVQFQATVVTAIEEIIARHRGQRAVIFCHGGVINVWTAHVLGMPARLFFEPDYTSIHRYLCASSSQRNLVSLNERAHLLQAE
jgi:probable phosphoglycerate mutase